MTERDRQRGSRTTGAILVLALLATVWPAVFAAGTPCTPQQRCCAGPDGCPERATLAPQTCCGPVDAPVIPASSAPLSLGADAKRDSETPVVRILAPDASAAEIAPTLRAARAPLVPLYTIHTALLI